MSIKSSKKTIDGLSTVREDTPAKEEEVDVHTEDDEDDIEEEEEEEDDEEELGAPKQLCGVRSTHNFESILPPR